MTVPAESLTRTPAIEASEILALVYEPVAVHVPDARRRVSTMLQAFSADTVELQDAAALIVSELATNVVQHGRGLMRINITVTPGQGAVPTRVRVEVADDNPDLPAFPIAAEGAEDAGIDESGRGLGLVAMVASCWGVDAKCRNGDVVGKVVWAEL
ncbi:ATP-binding protein [Streptomyces werraensis]|uniref:ATP-binding protein n=1 Tax=Streptomyces werraensis TaxID=68284 RepID=UPI0038105DFE